MSAETASPPCESAAHEGRIYLSPPCTDDAERGEIDKAFESGYIAPCGPKVDEFERALATLSGRRYAVAVSSGTAALDLSMAEYGVDASWVVIAPTLTFIATVGPAVRRGTTPVFVDCDETGNIDLNLLEDALKAHARHAPKLMVVAVDLYGRCCDYGKIEALCSRYGAILVDDAAEAVGATCSGRPAGSAGAIGIYSFNGNKIVTTSGGGALLTDDGQIAARARKRSQQSREATLWYEHAEIGYNYRLSNILAAIGLAQLRKLPSFVARRGETKRLYQTNASGTPIVSFLPPVDGENHWLTVALMRDEHARDEAIARLAADQIESRPVWKPMHLQPVFAGCRVFGGEVSQDLFCRGLCLPSGSGMTPRDVERVVAALS